MIRLRIAVALPAPPTTQSCVPTDKRRRACRRIRRSAVACIGVILVAFSFAFALTTTQWYWSMSGCRHGCAEVASLRLDLHARSEPNSDRVHLVQDYVIGFKSFHGCMRFHFSFGNCFVYVARCILGDGDSSSTHRRDLRIHQRKRMSSGCVFPRKRLVGFMPAPSTIDASRRSLP